MAFAVAKRAQGASWDSIGRMLDRPADAIRRVVDPSYVSPFPEARSVASVAPEQALYRRLAADGMMPAIAKVIAALHAASGPVPIDDLFDRSGRLPPEAGFKTRQIAAAEFRRVASANGYPVSVTPQGYVFRAPAIEALVERLRGPVR